MSAIDIEVGKNIRTLRKMRGISASVLAQKINKSQPTVSKYESGEISIDLDTLYEIAAVLSVHVEELFYLPKSENPYKGSIVCPAFFRGVSQLYGYVYDGRINRLARRLLDFRSTEDGRTKVIMYMNFESFDECQMCENTYKGTMKHFDAVTNISLQNRDVDMETAFIQIPAPSVDAPEKWSLFTGLSTRPIMPVARKLLLSKTRLAENDELIQKLKVSKEEIKRLKRYHMYSVL